MTDSTTQIAQRVLDRLRVLDSLVRGPVERDELDSLLTSVEKVVSLSDEGGQCEAQVRDCRHILDNAADGSNTLPSEEEAALIDGMVQVMRSVLRKAGQGPERAQDAFADRLVFLVPAAVLFLFVVTYLWFGMVERENTLQVYWRGEGEQYAEGNSRKLCATMDNHWEEYEITIGEFGASGIRLDPVGDGQLARRIEFRRIAILEDVTGSWQDLVFQPWPCDGCSIDVQGMNLVVVPDGEDPWLELPNLSGSHIRSVLVDARIQPARLWPWTWLRLYTRTTPLNSECSPGHEGNNSP